MTQPICPHVGAVDGDGNRCDPTEYPSFENRCFVAHLIDSGLDGLESGDQLLQRDQATYCLGESHRLCPRFRVVEPVQSGTALFDPLLPGVFLGDTAGEYTNPDEMTPPRVGLWVGVASLLLMIFLCGGSVAAYAGWQLAGRGIVALSQRMENQPQPSEQGQVILLVTPTPEAALPPGPLVIVTAAPTATPSATFAFPQAVTATPTSSGASGPVVITTPTPPNQEKSDPLAPELATAVAGALIISQPGDTAATPTRRPTPNFVVPTSTPGAPVVGGIQATGTVILPEARISFRSAHERVLPGACTILYWDVENVRAVFLNGKGVGGRGEEEFCILWTSQTFTLTVLKLDGSQETRTLTVILVPHTLTPTITPTHTPVLTPTPTWTPQGTPSVTPIPPSFGVQVTAEGGNQKPCSVGQSCEVPLLVENTGSLADEMFINLGKDGPWSSVICRDDGSCADTALSVGIGPGERRYVTLRVDVPGDAAGQSYIFQVEAVSGNSGRTVSSGPMAVTLTAQ